QFDLISSYWSGGYIGDPGTGSSLMAKQWAALSNMGLDIMNDITLKYKLVNGMKGLSASIAGDLKNEIRLNTPVVAIDYDTEGVALKLESGETIQADAAVVTVPVGA